MSVHSPTVFSQILVISSFRFHFNFPATVLRGRAIRTEVHQSG